MFRIFFYNNTETTQIYTLSLHDALPIYAKSIHYDKRNPQGLCKVHSTENSENAADTTAAFSLFSDRKSTRLNSSHGYISYAVFCLKKKNKTTIKSAKNQAISQ